jgi:hypothetical protein
MFAVAGESVGFASHEGAAAAPMQPDHRPGCLSELPGLPQASPADVEDFGS